MGIRGFDKNSDSLLEIKSKYDVTVFWELLFGVVGGACFVGMLVSDIFSSSEKSLTLSSPICDGGGGRKNDSISWLLSC